MAPYMFFMAHIIILTIATLILLWPQNSADQCSLNRQHMEEEGVRAQREWQMKHSFLVEQERKLEQERQLEEERGLKMRRHRYLVQLAQEKRRIQRRMQERQRQQAAVNFEDRMWKTCPGGNAKERSEPEQAMFMLQKHQLNTRKEFVNRATRLDGPRRWKDLFEVSEFLGRSLANFATNLSTSFYDQNDPVRLMP